MSTYVHSRASGRSAPKLKTGCTTCRRRKVRCDEKKPVCANCTRLKIPCGYQNPASQTRTSRAARQRNAPHQQVDSQAESGMASVMHLASPALNGEVAAARPVESMADSMISTASEIPLGDIGAGGGILGLTSPFQDVFFSSINMPDFGVGDASANGLLFDEQSLMLYAPQGGGYQNRLSPQGDSHARKETETRLLEHFTKSTNPISVILPSDTEWTSACRSVLVMARDSRCLSSAIYALSALHLYSTEKRDMLELALEYYQISSSELDIVFHNSRHDSSGGDGALKRAFATLFLLSHVELTAQSTPYAERWPLQHVRTAQARVREHSERIRTWAGISRRLLTWMSLLQTKVEYNAGTPGQGGSTSLERCSTQSSTLTRAIGDPFGRRGGLAGELGHQRTNESNSGETDDPRTPAELACDTINQPALDFHLRAQSFTPKIIALDKYHRKRGTLETEYEVLQLGHKISTELHSLWDSRPPTFSFLDVGAAGLVDVFQPSVAYSIVRDLRVYASNFWAHFIYLHRVAFVSYPPTEDVNHAIGQILRLTSDLENDRSQIARGGQEAYGLPHTMVWPLFMAGLECTVSDRPAVLQTIRQIQGLPSSDKVVLLLEEVLRKQDQTKVRADHREVRRELFESELSVLY